MTRTEQCLVAFLCLVLAALIAADVWIVLHSASDARVVDSAVCKVVLQKEKS